jgi:cyclopropane-fatty-acyl-phospholipid synthase
MSMNALVRAFEGAPVPDPIRRAVVEMLVAGARRRLMAPGTDGDAFAAAMAPRPIAETPEAANAQHYELPPAFFVPVLGPRMKYSCCLYGQGVAHLAEAETHALAETCAHADLADGQDILELGCGWGSLSLWMAERYPAARILAVSNSAPQRAFIEARASALGLANLRVATADMNSFDVGCRFDRVVSVEMFEHMANWRALLARARGWLKPDGRLFIHVFSHRSACYRFNGADDWVGRYFFTGGVMPSHGLIRQFADLVTVEGEWRWNGEHYRRTAEAWLANYDHNFQRIWPVLQEVYGEDARLWARRWRLFFLAVAGLFGHQGGLHWGVSHYRLKAA